jgi:hypothetical protein
VGRFLVAARAAAAPAASLEPVGSFAQPIFVTSDPDDPDRFFVVEREGTVRAVEGGDASLFADLTGLVSCCAGERGLLSIAPAPDFAASGRFYAAYTGNEAAGGDLGDIHVDAFRHDGAGQVYRLEGESATDCALAEEPEPEPGPEPAPAPTPAAPGAGQPMIERALGATRVRARVVRRWAARPRGVRVRIVVRVAPCAAAHRGRPVRLNRGGRRIASKRLDRRCVARFTVRLARRATFRALFRPSGAAHLLRSRRLTVLGKGVLDDLHLLGRL